MRVPGTQGLQADSRRRLLVGVFDKVATQREGEIFTSGIANEDDVLWSVPELDEANISVE